MPEVGLHKYGWFDRKTEGGFEDDGQSRSLYVARRGGSLVVLPLTPAPLPPSRYGRPNWLRGLTSVRHMIPRSRSASALTRATTRRASEGSGAAGGGEPPARRPSEDDVVADGGEEVREPSGGGDLELQAEVGVGGTTDNNPIV